MIDQNVERKPLVHESVGDGRAGACQEIEKRQFALYGDLKKGLRPSFEGAMEPALARAAYDDFVVRARQRIRVETGVFAADMRGSSVNDGPVTIWIDSEKSAGMSR